MRPPIRVKRPPMAGAVGGLQGRRREGGQIIVLFAMVLVLILVAASVVIDLGVLRNNRQVLVNAMDAGALAGGTLMPVDGTQPGAAAKVTTLINNTVQGTYPGLKASDYKITYRCLIGTGAGDPAVFDAADITAFIPLDCNPSHALGGSPDLGNFVGAGPTRSSDCRPDLGDTCNVVVVTGNVATPYGFGRVVGIDQGYTGAVPSAACKGACGQLRTVFDVELVIDTSGSMGSNNSNGHPRIHWAKLAATQLVTDLDNNGGVGPGANRIGITRFGGDYTSSTAATSLGGWSSKAAGVTSIINGLNATGATPTEKGVSLGTTDLGANARNSIGGAVKRVLILLSDGRPNPDMGPNGKAATITAKNERPTATQIATYLASADVAYSILIGTVPNPYPIPLGKIGPPDLNGLYSNVVDPELMKLLSKPSAVNPTAPVYFNVVDGSGLPNVFNQIAAQLLDPHAHLISLYPAPIVTNVGLKSGSKNNPVTITITGQYFTGATAVRFGSNPATSLTVLSDTSIRATGAAGPTGTTVDIVVTSLGGSSPVVSADHFTYP